MNLQQLHYFLTSAEHGSFSAAARELRLAQPSVSEPVRELEAELGVTLFTRVGRGLVLTEAGRRFHPEAERVLHAIDGARDAVRSVKELRGGTLSFGTFGSPSDYLIVNVAADFRRRFPDVRLRLVGVNSSQVADQVREGRLEAGLVVLPVDDDGLDVRPFRHEELVYASREPDRIAEPMTVERLADAPLILYEAHFGSADPTRRQLLDRAQRAGVSLSAVIEVESLEAAVALADRGLGDTIVARGSLKTLRVARSLKFVSFADPLFDTFAFIARRDAPVSPATQALVAIIEKRVAETEALYGGATSAGDAP